MTLALPPAWPWAPPASASCAPSKLLASLPIPILATSWRTKVCVRTHIHQKQTSTEKTEEEARQELRKTGADLSLSRTRPLSLFSLLPPPFLSDDRARWAVPCHPRRVNCGAGATTSRHQPHRSTRAWPRVKRNTLLLTSFAKILPRLHAAHSRHVCIHGTLALNFRASPILFRLLTFKPCSGF